MEKVRFTIKNLFILNKIVMWPRIHVNKCNIYSKLTGILTTLLVNNEQCDGIGEFELNTNNL